jgi:hypothetical protein
MLGSEIPGLLPVNPSGGKIARAQAISPLIEAGNVYLPHPDYAPWVNDFIEECVQFPNGAHDDQVDAMTQALLRWHMAQPQIVVYWLPPVEMAVGIIALIPLFLATGLSQGTAKSGAAGPSDPGVRSGTPGAGSSVAGLTTGQLSYFTEGLNVFNETIFVQNPPPGGDAGLGPRFNSNSCVSCHSFPSPGGSSPPVNPQIAVATAMGANNRIPAFLKPDGPALEVRFKNKADGTPDGGVHALFTISGRSDANGCNIQQEDFSNTSILSFRIPTPVFGAGLIEAIYDSTLKSNLSNNSSAKASMGISGKLNTSGNDGTITRFGWKAQNKALHIFAGEAYNVENGVTNYLFPQERQENSGCRFSSTPESTFDFETGATDDLTLFAAYMSCLWTISSQLRLHLDNTPGPNRPRNRAVFALRIGGQGRAEENRRRALRFASRVHDIHKRSIASRLRSELSISDVSVVARIRRSASKKRSRVQVDP